MRAVTLALMGALLLGPTALAVAQDDSACAVADAFIHADFPLPHVQEAIDNKLLSVVVLGSGSSTIGGPGGSAKAYPSRLEAVLSARFPGVKVRVTAATRSRETAADMEKQLASLLAKEKPALLVWQTGTVEAMRGVDADEFRSALEDGVEVIHRANSDVVLMNMQYSPRTETIVTPEVYADVMRFVALQQELLLFDRFSIMKHWSELGIFDFYATTRKVDVAEHVHQCIGQLLGDLIVEAAKSTQSQGRDIH
jgi:hypothetical protein